MQPITVEAVREQVLKELGGGLGAGPQQDKNPEINGKVKELVAATTTAYLLPPVNNNVNGRANELTNELEQHWKFNVRLGTRIDLSYCP